MILRLMIAIFVALLVTASGHYYIYMRVVEPLFNNRYSISIFAALWALTFFGFLLIRLLPHVLRKFIEIIMFTWMGSVFIVLVLCLLTAPLQLYFHNSILMQKNLSVGILISSFAVISYSIFQALRNPSYIETLVPVPSTMPREIENIRAVVLSDIHVSGLIGKRKMRSLAKRVNALNPDIIFITGDLMDGTLKQLKKEIAPLKDLKAKHGILYITGNHEYYSGPIAWKQHFGEVFKWNILSNASTVVDIQGVNFNVLGIEDKHYLSFEKIPRKQDTRLQIAVDHLFEHNSESYLQENSLNILLAHQPKDAKYLTPFPWIHLQISGHTHGGQIWPLKYIVKKDQKYVAGLYKILKNQFIYVNQGTGFWGPPMRLGTTGEITVMGFKREGVRK